MRKATMRSLLTYTASLQQAKVIGEVWTTAWSQTDPSAWTSIYAPDASYTDYAFNFVRRGHAGLKNHFELWRTAHPDFHAEIAEVWRAQELADAPGKLKCSIRTINKGTFTNDLPSLKANGKKFNFYAVVDIVWRESDGLIERIDEWYHRQFDAEILERD